MAPFSRSSFIPKSISLSPECRNDPVVLELKVINNNMRKIDAYVVLGLKGKRKQLEDQRKRDTDSKRREKKLGLEKQRKANPINFIKEKLPRTGFLDAIRNFILYTAMGMAVPFALKNLPKILGIVKFIIPFYKLFEDFAGNVLGGIVSAIDFGYKVHDKVRNIFKKVTGDKFEKSFDDLEKNLNTFLNLAVVLGLAVAGSGAIPRPKGGKVPSGFPASAKTLPKGSLSRLNDSYSRFIAGQANIGDRARLVKNGFINLGQATTKGGPNVLAKGATKSGGKFIGKFGRVFSRIPVVGGLINFAVSMMMGEKIGRASAKAVGSTFGAALGTFVPFPGVGTILGGIVGDIVGGALYDTLESFGKPKKYASGGRVGAKSYSRVSRSIKKAKIKRPPKQVRQRTMPGKNVGGEDNIKKLFPDSEDDKTMSSLRLLKKNSALMKRAGVFGNLLSSGVEMMALGQKIERPTLMGLERYLAFVIDSSIDNQTSANAKMLGASMFAMAGGGVVPTSRTISQNGVSTGSAVAKEIVRSFTAMLDNRSSEIFQNIRKELELQGPGGAVPGQTVEPGDENLSGYGTPEQRALLKAISFAEGTEKGYGIIYGGANVPELERGELTISEVLEMQRTGLVKGRNAGYKKDKHNSDATGKYQFMSYTLREEAEKQGISLNEKFTPEMQDRLILGRIAKFRGVTPELLKKEGLSARVVNMLAPEFASFPTLSGRSHYEGQFSKNLSSIQQVYKQSLSSGKLNLSGSDPISFGNLLLKMKFTVAENRFFTKFKGFNPLGTSYVGTHSNSADHAEHSLDITDHNGEEREGIERLKVLYKSMFSRRKQLGIDELIFDPVGQWFEGMPTHSPPGSFKHPNHIHVRFKTPASRARFRRNSGPLISSIQTTEQMNLPNTKPLNVAYSPELDKTRGLAGRISQDDPIAPNTIIAVQKIYISPEIA